MKRKRQGDVKVRLHSNLLLLYACSMMSDKRRPCKNPWTHRATTEFTGWPTVSTTPMTVEQILAAAKAKAGNPPPTTGEPSTSTTTTTTTTTTTSAPTTPGICAENCDLAATIKLVGGVKWVPELLDRNTKEWQLLANDVHDKVNRY